MDSLTICTVYSISFVEGRFLSIAMEAFHVRRVASARLQLFSLAILLVHHEVVLQLDWHVVLVQKDDLSLVPRQLCKCEKRNFSLSIVATSHGRVSASCFLY